MSEKVLMKGNEAFSCAAIRSGCRFYFGYPITPQNEIPEYMAKEMGKVGGAFIQAESELASVNMAYGAACAGGRVLISSSSPGIALMQEAFSFACSAQVPFVAISVSRGGPGIGSIQPGQADYYQATRGGGNGDYHMIVYAPASIQEAVDTMGKAFDVSDAYRNPVIVLVDGMLGQMMEPIVLPEMKELANIVSSEKEKPWAISGHKNKRERNRIQSLTLQPELLEKKVEELAEKYKKMQSELTEYETFDLEDAEIVFVAYGTTSRIADEAREILASEGIKVGLIRPITLWPFPYKAFDEIGNKTKTVLSVELSQGQMMDDVLIGVKGRWPVSLVKRVGGMWLTPPEVAEKAKAALKEVGQ